MKKSVLYLLAILFALSSCSKKEADVEEVENEFEFFEYYSKIFETYFEDYDYFEEYFGDWDTTIFYQVVSESETYKLLEALIDHIDVNRGYIIADGINAVYHTVTHFNEYLWNNKEAMELFEKEDCVYVLTSTYLNSLKTVTPIINGNLLDSMLLNNVFLEEIWLYRKWLDYLHYVLTSEIFMSKMNITEKIQLMVLVLERAKYTLFKRSTEYNIMISIMLSSNYTPFVNDIKPVLYEGISGAVYIFEPDLLKWDQAYSVIAGYAIQFINDNK